MHELTRASCAALAAVALVGCGNAEGSPTAGGPSAQTTAASAGTTNRDPVGTATATPGTPTDGAAGGDGAAGADSTSSSGSPAAAAAVPTGSQSPKPPMRIVLDASLSAACVIPGGTQTLTIRKARPGMQVIFDTTYADGKSGKEHGGFDSEGTRTDRSGGYTRSWVVSPLAPAGEAETHVGAVDAMGFGERKLTFDVARTCP